MGCQVDGVSQCTEASSCGGLASGACPFAPDDPQQTAGFYIIAGKGHGDFKDDPFFKNKANQWGAPQNFRWLAQVARNPTPQTTTTVATTTTVPQTTSTLATTTTPQATTSTLATTTTVPQTTQPPPTTSTLASTTQATTQPPSGICSASSVNAGAACSDAVIDCGCSAPASESLPWTRRELQTCAEANGLCSSGRNGTPCCAGAGTCEGVGGGEKRCLGGVVTTTVPPVTTCKYS